MVTAQYILDEIDIETTGLNDYDPETPLWGNITHHPNQSIALNPKEIKGKRVPSVIGMGAKDAVYLLESQGLRVHLSGMGKVKSQSIPAGNTLVKGKTIQLRLH